MKSTYFAALPEYSDEFGTAVMKRVDGWFEALPRLTWYQRAKQGYLLRYGLPSDASPFDVTEIGKTGETGELSQAHVNVFGNLVHRSVTQTVSGAPIPKPIAANGDHKSQAQCLVASSVVDYERRDKNFEAIQRQVADAAFTLSTGYALVAWDFRGGKQVDPGGFTLLGPDGAPLPSKAPATYEGRLVVKSYMPWHVITNLAKRNTVGGWKIRCDFWNKYDLAVRFPHLAEEIDGLAPDHRLIQEWRQSRQQFMDSDEVPVYVFHHPPTDALSKGREAWVIATGDVLLDVEHVYGEKVPLIRMCPSEMLGTDVGHTPCSDLISLQQVLNMCMSSAITNNANNAVGNLSITSDSNLSTYQLEGGAWVWEREPGSDKPEAINFTNTAPETYKLAEMIRGFMLDFIGQSDTSMGKATAQMSGSYAALLDAKTKEFASLFQASFNQTVIEMGNATINCYKNFAKSPRALEVIVGEDQRYLLPEFTGQDISDVSRVTVEAQNPMQDTTAGKMELVNQLIAAEAITGPTAAKAIAAVYRTGSLQPALAGPEQQEMLIKAENAELARGLVPKVRDEDLHVQHIMGHATVLGTPEARRDPRVEQAHSSHIIVHLMALLGHPETNFGVPRPDVLALLFATGQQPINLPVLGFPGIPLPGTPMPPPGMMIPGPGAIPGAIPPPGGANSGPGGPPGGSGGGGRAPGAPPQPPGPTGQPGRDGMPSQPRMPKNPATGQRAPPPPPP